MVTRFKFIPILTLAGTFFAIVVARGAEAAETFSQERWDKLLKANVTPEGWVNYENLRNKDAGELKAYLQEIAKADPSKMDSKNDQKVFWINAYNAICLQTLIDQGLPAEVPHAKFFGKNIFTQRTYKVAGKVRSLDDIEHGILRKDFKDPRLHAALVCGASSCPRLRPEAYVGGRLDRQLDDQVKGWLTVQKNKKGERKNHLDREAKILYISKIFSWYEEDFGGSKEGVLKFIQGYLDASDREFIEKNKVEIEYLPYDWALNRQ